VRVRHVEEIFPEQLISQNQYWGRHARRSRTSRSRALATSSGRTASPWERRRGSATWRRS
jgi:hypothetical protein